MGFKTVLNFSLFRILKKKFFRIASVLIFALLILLNIGIYLFSKSTISASITVLTITIILSVFWIGAVSINSTVDFIIKDEKTGVQSLQLRRGVSATNILIAKLLAINIIVFSYIFIVYLICALFPVMFFSTATKLIESQVLVGMFALIPVHLVVFNLTLLVTILFKSNKISISMSWIMTMILAMVNIFGPLSFAFAPQKTPKANGMEINRYFTNYYLINPNFSTTEFQNWYADYKELQSDLFLKLTSESSITKYKIFQFLNASALEGGMLVDFYSWMQAGTFIEILENLFKTNGLNDFYQIKITDEEITETISDLEHNSFFNFLKDSAITSNGLSEQEIRESFFIKNGAKNLKGDNQFNAVLQKTNLNETQSWVFDLNSLILSKFNKFLGISGLDGSGYQKIFYDEKNNHPPDVDFYSNINLWKANSSTTMGSKTYASILSNLLANFNTYDKEGYYEIYSQSKLSYLLNPLMWFHEMIYFSGIKDYAYDTYILNNKILMLPDFRILTVKDNKIIYKRVFSTTLNYVGLLTLASILLTTSVFIFNKKIYIKTSRD